MATHCTKINYTSPGQARAMLLRIRAEMFAKGRAKLPVAVHPCPAPGHAWHITSQRPARSKWQLWQPTSDELEAVAAA